MPWSDPNAQKVEEHGTGKDEEDAEDASDTATMAPAAVSPPTQ